jgi:hypothetical protein
MPGTGGMIGAGGHVGAGGATGVCSPACGPCEICTAAGACDVDPNSTWDLAAIAAALNPVDPGNQIAPNTWDVPTEPIEGPNPDPFCELDMPPPTTVIGQTATIPNTLAPIWSALVGPNPGLLNPPQAPLRAGDLLAGGKPWILFIGDDDAGILFPSGETMCTINGPLLPSDFRAGGFMRTNIGSCFSASFKLTCRH